MNARQGMLLSAAIITVTAIAAPSLGDRKPSAPAKRAVGFDATSLQANASPANQGDEGGIAGVSITENFETFALGAGCGQLGWAGFCGVGPPPVGFLVVANTPPDPVLGAQSALHQSDGSGVAGNEIRSPALAAPEVGRIEADLTIANTTSTYGMSTANCITAGCLINTRILFQPTGNIEVLQLQPGNCTTGVFTDTGVDWTPAVRMRIGIEVDGVGALKVYKDGALIFTGVDISVSCAPANPPGIGQFQIFAQNIAGQTTATMIVDNVGGPVSSCDGDINGSGAVDVDDLVAVILSWGQPDSSGVVDVDDLVGVILGWGPC